MNKPNSYKEIPLVYDEAIDQSSEFLLFLEKVLGKKRKLKILDLGCGTGKYSIPLAEKGFTVKGVDSSKKMIATARKKTGKIKNISFCKGNIESLKLKEKFDLVISCDCFNHFLDEKKLLKAFKNVFGLLEKNGKFAFQLCTKNYFENLVWEEP